MCHTVAALNRGTREGGSGKILKHLHPFVESVSLRRQRKSSISQGLFVRRPSRREAALTVQSIIDTRQV